MLGFRIKLKNQVIDSAIENGVTSVILNRVIQAGRDECDLQIVGLDLEKKQNIDWFKDDLKIGDEIIIEVKEIEKISATSGQRNHDSEKQINDGKVKYYHSLKKELEEKGLI